MNKEKNKRERKACPYCESTCISTLHGKYECPTVPDKYRGLKHYRCRQCENRFFVPNKTMKPKLSKYTPNTIDYDKVLKLYNKNMKDSEIAKQLNCSVPSIQKWRYKNNLKPHSRTT